MARAKSTAKKPARKAAKVAGDVEDNSYRKYSDAEKASALAAWDANGRNFTLTAKELGIPATTLQSWVNGSIKIHSDVTKFRCEQRSNLADRLEEIAHQLLDAMPEKIKKAGLQQAATSMAIAVDKMQILRNLPTSIHGSAEPTDDELLIRLRDIALRVRERRDAALLDARGASECESGSVDVGAKEAENKT